MKDIIAEHDGKVWTMNDLRKFIVMNFGSDERTIQGYIKTMRMTGVIEDVGDSRFKIHKV